MDSLKELLSMVLPVSGMWSLMPEAASTQTSSVDPVFYFLVWTMTLLFLFVVVPMAWFCYRYRRRHGKQRALSQKDHNQFLEILWSALPLVYLGILFVWGFYGFLNLYMAPLDAKELKVIGQKWMWTVQYPKEEISVSGQGVVIAVPLNQPIKLVMSSQDVIHSFFVPNFRVKQDVVPGRYSTLWFEANKIGEYPVFCAEYCGDQHSNMLALIKVMPVEEYTEWVAKMQGATKGLSPKELGQSLYKSKGCVACHTVDGSKGIAPSFKGIYGKKEELSDGKSVIVDDQRIREKLLDPVKAGITKGYPPVMPTFRGQLKEQDINGIIEFIKSLK